MAPKKKVPPTDGGHVANQKKIPVAVKAVRDKMEALQTPLTSTSLKDMLTAKEFNNLGNNFRNSLTPDEQQEHMKRCRATNTAEIGWCGLSSTHMLAS